VTAPTAVRRPPDSVLGPWYSVGVMAELELTRATDDRRRYVLEGVGTLRFERGLGVRRATAESGDRTWRLTTRFWRRSVEAADETGTPVGSFDPRALRRGGALEWGGRHLQLRPASVWRERYALADGDRELAVFDAKGWGKRPVRVTVDDPTALEPGLLLFAAFVARGLAEHGSTAASAGATAGS
jgi:hypothetical protein